MFISVGNLCSNHEFSYYIIRLLFPCRCIGRWLAERSATCPLCKTELYDEDEESSSSEEEGGPEASGAEHPSPSASNWRSLLSMLNFGLEGGSENLVTVTANNGQTPQETQGGGSGAAEELQSSSELSWWRQWLPRRRGRRRRTFAEEHGVSLRALQEPLLQAENGDVENNNASNTETNENMYTESRPDAPEDNSPPTD